MDGGGGEEEEGDEGSEVLALTIAVLDALEMNSPIGINWNEMSSEGSINRCS